MPDFDATPAPDNPSADPVGSTRQALAALGHVGKFRLVKLLGAGGMGTVHRAWQEDLGRWVAIKMLKSDGPDELARFLREARTAAKLSHPHIVPIYEAGEFEGKPYIALEYIDGQDLKKRRVEVREALALIRDAARAIQHAHDRGIIHRDIKPANLMLSSGGQVYVTDFGLAKSLGAPSGLSVTGDIFGTPYYMPPEQARGDKVDARSDVYSLGATLYELVAGRPPFEGGTMAEVLHRVLDEDPPAPPGVDRDIVTIVQKAMQKEPSRRYATAEELAADLQRFLDGEPVVARRSSMAYRLRWRLMRNPAAWIAAAAGLIGILVAAGFGVRSLSLQRKSEYALRLVRAAGQVESGGAEWLLRAEELSGGTAVEAEAAQELRTGFEKVLGEVGEQYPDVGIVPAYRCWMRLLLGEGDAALADLARVIADHPDDPFPRLVRARWRLREMVRETELPAARFVLQAGRSAVVQTLPQESPRAREMARLAREDLEAVADMEIWALLDPSDRYRTFAEGMRRFAAREFERATPLLEEVRANKEFRLDALMLIGMSELYRERFAEAAPIWDRVVGERPASEWGWANERAGHVYYSLALVLDAAGESAGASFERAVELARRAARLAPEDPGHQDLHGVTLLGVAGYLEVQGADALPALEEARHVFERLVSADPGNSHHRYHWIHSIFSVAKFRLAAGQDAREDLKEALREADTLVRLQPNWFAAPALRASVKMAYAQFAPEDRARQEFEEALDDLEDALRLNPDDQAIVFNQGSVRLMLAEWLMSRGRTEEALERMREAEGDFEAVLLKDPGMTAARLHRATAWMKMGEAISRLKIGSGLEEYRRALEEFEDLMSRPPVTAMVEVNTANALLRLGIHRQMEETEALELLTRSIEIYAGVIERMPDNVPYRLNAAVVYRERAKRRHEAGDLDEARADEERALEALDWVLARWADSLQARRSRADACLHLIEHGWYADEQAHVALLERAREDVERWGKIEPQSNALRNARRRLQSFERGTDF